MPGQRARSSPRWRRRRSPAVTRRPSREHHDPVARCAPRGPPRRSGPPSRRTAAARPSTSRRGCTRAQCGVKVAPRAPATSSRSRVAAASSQTVPSSHDAECAAGDPGPRLLRGGAGHDQRPALDEAGAQALLGVDPAHLVDGVAQGGELGEGGGAAVPPVEGVGADRPQRRHPAAVAAAGAEADVLGLEHEHLDARAAPAAGSRRSTARCSRRRRRRRPRSGQRRSGAGGARRHRVVVGRATTGPPWGSPTTAARSTAAGAHPATSEVVLGLGEHRAQPALDLVELGRAHRQRRGQLHDRVAAVVGAAVQAGVEQRLGQEAAQQPLALGVVERLAGLPCP